MNQEARRLDSASLKYPLLSSISGAGKNIGAAQDICKAQHVCFDRASQATFGSGALDNGLVEHPVSTELPLIAMRDKCLLWQAEFAPIFQWPDYGKACTTIYTIGRNNLVKK